MARSHKLLSLLLLPVLAVAFLIAGPAVGDTATEHYVIDKGHSAVMFKIKHLGVSYTHGRFNDFTGFFSVNDADLSKAKIELDIASTSIDSNSKERDDHLRKEDYFSCEKFPSISFESTSIAMTSKGVYRVTGDFTLLGVTKEITFRMTKVGEGNDPWGGHRLGYEGLVLIKRSDFGMTTMLKGIGDNVHITLAIEGIRKDKKKDGAAKAPKKDAKK